ncbi:High-affnity carbon uptake protein Hat/HatR [Myxococcus hansupus]|uniref:High-affnity carbon uptake protein Hat/HatR n=1 Tax=Pseudomyxococcus hansupus TaxID=1297742 RepID=A0A0H4X447_9BACT|nr:WD40 repeat domain-containing protein [Myxococcus hansupus]AKQ68410.1 High-affnity carbon uptake protein Hat/HatR [Myxococcus hansupus]
MTDSTLNLADFSTLEQLVKDQGLDALQAALDTQGAGLQEDARTARIIQRALTLDAEFLRAHPESLFQCLYNRLRWFDAPDAAEHFVPGETGPWSNPQAPVWRLANQWRAQWEARGDVAWVESLRPIPGPLEGNDQSFPHGAQVLCAAYSPSGALLATGTWEDGRNVHVWDVATGKCIQTMEGHEGEVRGIAWSPDGTRLASSSRDHDACIWDVETGALLHAMTGQEGQVTSVAFSPDGQWLAAANLGWRVRLFNVATGQEVRTLAGHEQSVLSVDFHPSGRWLASGASDDTARVWDLQTGAQVARIPTPTSVSSVAFSPNGEWLALNGLDGIIRVETRTWKPVPGGCGHAPYSDIAWIGDSKLGALTFNRTEVLDARSGEVLATRPYLSDGFQRSAAFHPDGKRFALTAADGRLLVGDVDGAPAPTLLAEQDRVQHLWGHSEGVRGIARQKQSIWSIDAEGRADSLPPDYREAPMQPWRVSRDGTLLACPLMYLGERPFRPAIQLIDARSQQPVRALSAPAKDIPAQDPGGITTTVPMAFSPDGQLLAASLLKGAVHVWRVVDGVLLHTLRGPREPATLVDFTPDGAYVVSSYESSSRLMLHDVRSGAVAIDTQAVVDPSLAYAAAKQAPRVAVGLESGDVLLFDLPTGGQRTLHVSKSPVIGLGLSPDGDIVAACCQDARGRVFDARTGSLLHDLPHTSLAFAVAVGDDLIVTQANDMRSRIFDLQTGAPHITLNGCTAPAEVLERRYWETLGDLPVAFHRRKERTPFVHFPDTMEETLILRDGLVLARGRTERDLLYVLKLHDPSARSAG